MKNELISLYEARIEALEYELEFTRQYIYRDHLLRSGITAETVQDLINAYIKDAKKEAL